MCIVRYLLLLTRCVEHGWSSDRLNHAQQPVEEAEREVCCCVRDDRSRVRKKQIATAIQLHVDLPHVPVTDHCAAAAGRQGLQCCMKLGLTTLSALLLCWVVCCLFCVLCSYAKKRIGRYYE